MDVTSTAGLPKRPTPKRKAEAAPQEPVKKAAASTRAKKPKSSIRIDAKQPVDTSETAVATLEQLTDVRAAIAVAAYYLAEQRNFASGHELEDWLQAERQVLGVR
jgi:hypothetical protein